MPLTLTIEPTDQTTKLDGVEVRLWEGRSPNGVSCLVFVHRIAVHQGFDRSEFDAELSAKPQPGNWATCLPDYVPLSPVTEGVATDGQPSP